MLTSWIEWQADAAGLRSADFNSPTFSAYWGISPSCERWFRKLSARRLALVRRLAN